MWCSLTVEWQTSIPVYDLADGCWTVIRSLEWFPVKDHLAETQEQRTEFSPLNGIGPESQVFWSLIASSLFF